MPFDFATISTIATVGQKLYEFVKFMGERGQGDPLQAVADELYHLRQDIAALGRTLLSAIQQATSQIVENQHIEQLSRLQGAHEAIADYLRTHSPAPPSPVLVDPNYVEARDDTTEVLAFFTRNDAAGNPDLFHFGNYVQAMNQRIEFVTGLHPCWFTENRFIDEIRQGVDRLAYYIAVTKAAIEGSFRIEADYEVVKNDLQKPVGFDCWATVYEFEVAVGGGYEFESFPGSPRSVVNGLRRAAEAEKIQLVAARKQEVMGYYDLILEEWNALLVRQARASIRRALLNRRGPGVLPTAEDLSIAALRKESPVDAKGVRYRVPLREYVFHVLRSPEFERRQQKVLAVSDPRALRLLFAKALQREPSAEEEKILMAVRNMFGPKALFGCVLYSKEYEERFGEGLPTPELSGQQRAEPDGV